MVAKELFGNCNTFCHQILQKKANLTVLWKLVTQFVPQVFVSIATNPTPETFQKEQSEPTVPEFSNYIVHCFTSCIVYFKYLYIIGLII